MPALALDQPNFQGNLDFCTVNERGRLVDAFKVEFVITTEDGVTQKFPSSGRANVTTVGKLSTGRYWVYNTVSSQAFAPTVVGGFAADTRYRVTWYWRTLEADVEQSLAQYFDVTAASGTRLDFVQYATIVDVRREGITSATLSDSAIIQGIRRWQPMVDRFCRQFFYPRRIEMRLDGREARLLMMPLPIIGVETVQINDTGYDLSSDDWVAQTMFGYPDGRRNPHIAFATGRQQSIYSAPAVTGRLSRFSYGNYNQLIKGMFGFVDDSFQTPSLVSRAMLRLLLYQATPLAVGGGSSNIGPAGVLTVEKTDGHERHYAWPDRGPSLDYKVFGDAEVIELLNFHKAPLVIRASSSPEYGAI